MLQQFLNHIAATRLLKPTDKILLSVSGGIDSMVMLYLFKAAGFHAGVAHCNYQLRGGESDGDMKFVAEKTEACGFPFHVRKFDTSAYANSKGISVQMAARELRYDWFKELTQEHSYTVIATAHHLNDALETILLNLAKGTGLDGLTGIPVKQQKIIRPLLFASREQITEFAHQHGITWREDSSNVSDYYQRNLIRNQVIPLLKQINPNLEGTFVDTLFRINAAREFARLYLKDFSVRNIYYDGKHVLIKKEEIVNKPFGAVVLWELLKDLGFNFDQCIELAKVRQPGQTFHVERYDLVTDRNDFILTRKSSRSSAPVIISKGDVYAEDGSTGLTFDIVNAHEFTMVKDENVALLDADKIAYPLTWRDWMDGDRFVPLGMTQNKKVSDFLVDEKVSLPEKGNVKVLESGGEIVWVVGRRIADGYKVTERTKRVMIIKSISLEMAAQGK
jgi:tRNA(Ile)-lysidine synthase